MVKLPAEGIKEPKPVQDIEKSRDLKEGKCPYIVDCLNEGSITKKDFPWL
jgi:hypothetical protein